VPLTGEPVLFSFTKAVDPVTVAAFSGFENCTSTAGFNRLMDVNREGLNAVSTGGVEALGLASVWNEYEYPLTTLPLVSAAGEYR
jgi:hypothetical protein